MTWLFLTILIAAAVAAYLGGRGLARRRGQALPTGQRSHSRPSQHGAYALIWTAVPALVVLIAASMFSVPVERQLTVSGAPEQVQELQPFQRQAFLADAAAIGAGRPAARIWPAPYAELLPAEGRRVARIDRMLTLGGIVGAILAGLLGALFVFVRVRSARGACFGVVFWVGGLLFAFSVVAVLTALGIIGSVVYDSIGFFSGVPVTECLFGAKWSPQTAIRADQI